MGRSLPNRSIPVTPPGGDIRLLAPTARHASARALLALAAIAALALTGCGGGGSGSEEASGTAAGAQQDSSAPSKAQAKKREGSASEKAAEPQQGSGASAASPSAKGQGKQGKTVQLPKGAPEPTATPTEEAQATVADIALQSPDIGAGSALPATFTCDGKDTWPNLQWQGIPSGTQELVLFAMNVAPVQGELFFDWALAGIDPSLSGLESGQLPKGAVQGQNSFGKADYELCPKEGAETHVFVLYALPQHLAEPKGFDPAELRRQVQAISKNAGILAATYGRG